jgi:hypothetical protein
MLCANLGRRIFTIVLGKICITSVTLYDFIRLAVDVLSKEYN